jgi:hypothetical protein
VGWEVANLYLHLCIPARGAVGEAAEKVEVMVVQEYRSFFPQSCEPFNHQRDCESRASLDGSTEPQALTRTGHHLENILSK